MNDQIVFRRYEMKYLMTKWQRDQLLKKMETYMMADRFGHSEIRNLYYDTDSYQLIRASMERPTYKEKLRLRSYGQVNSSSQVFAELKKKYMGVVYKRRISADYSDALRYLRGESPFPDCQIGREIAYTFLHYGCPEPKVFLAYDRDAFCERGGGELRITFDEDIRCRTNQLTLAGDSFGIPLMASDQVLMELKTPDALPMWLVRALSDMEIRKGSFSKYGSAYAQIIRNEGVYKNELFVQRVV